MNLYDVHGVNDIHDITHIHVDSDSHRIYIRNGSPELLDELSAALHAALVDDAWSAEKNRLLMFLMDSCNRLSEQVDSLARLLHMTVSAAQQDERRITALEETCGGNGSHAESAEKAPQRTSAGNAENPYPGVEHHVHYNASRVNVAYNADGTEHHVHYNADGTVHCSYKSNPL